MRSSILAIAGVLPFFSSIVLGNVEKTIFLGPPTASIPPDTPHLDPLGLEHLSPQDAVVRTYVNASFPSVDAPKGTDSWFFLENLMPGQRYEVRVCWLATQPTSFTLSTYPLSQTMGDPALLSALSRFSASRLATEAATAADPQMEGAKSPRQVTKARPQSPTLINDSVLFLRVQAAADYFSLDPALMQQVPPVVVDVILDPFVWNVFPRSLVPTAAWMVLVVVVAMVVARWVGRELGRVIDDARAERDEQEKKKTKKET